MRNRHGILCSPEYFPLMISAPGDEVNPVAVWTQKPVVSEFLAGWVGQIVGWVFLLSKYCEDEGGMAAANAGAGNGLCFGPE